MIERLFAGRRHGSSVGAETLAGTTTFPTMAYIVFVDSAILAAAIVAKCALAP
ncbi:MAG: hypothetical protein M0006_16340 [Magnetospirillum sp.]|nr:hypothetical protein [Magnetospirillum sp.]